mmetsp:Transcript_122763/g.393202  ORF Transcript_122763/g.393202 Transcript_122763/m.393202 type:complete len:265 (+) Transcript_122763:339-1133(+)
MRAHVGGLGYEDSAGLADLVRLAQHRLRDGALQVFEGRLRQDVARAARDERHDGGAVSAREGTRGTGVDGGLADGGHERKLGGAMRLRERILGSLREHLEVAGAEAIREQRHAAHVEDGRLSVHGLLRETLALVQIAGHPKHADQAVRHWHAMAFEAGRRPGTDLQGTVDRGADIAGVPAPGDGLLQEGVQAPTSFRGSMAGWRHGEGCGHGGGGGDPVNRRLAKHIREASGSPDLGLLALHHQGGQFFTAQDTPSQVAAHKRG